MKESFEVSGCPVELYYEKAVGVPLAVFIAGDEDCDEIYSLSRAASKRSYALACVKITDWNALLSPYPAPAVFKGGEDFAGGAKEFLKTVEKIVVEAKKRIPSPSFVAVCGYSLAGLFAVYATYESEVFSRAASASGSMWYPAFTDFVKSRAPKNPPRKMYFSLGDKEDRSRNPVLSRVRIKTEEIVSFYKEAGVPVIYELNEGNHFQGVTGRCARAIASIIED